VSDALALRFLAFAGVGFFGCAVGAMRDTVSDCNSLVGLVAPLVLARTRVQTAPGDLVRSSVSSVFAQADEWWPLALLSSVGDIHNRIRH
jgi:hypothetical protein